MGVIFIVFGLMGSIFALIVGVLTLIPGIISLLPSKSKDESTGKTKMSPGSYSVDVFELSRAYNLYVYLANGAEATVVDGNKIIRTPEDDVRDAVARGDYNVKISGNNRSYWRKITNDEAMKYADYAPAGYFQRLQNAPSGVPEGPKDYAHITDANGQYRLHGWSRFAGIKNNKYGLVYVMPMEAGAQPFIAALVFDPVNNRCKLMYNNTAMNDKMAVTAMNRLIRTGMYK